LGAYIGITFGACAFVLLIVLLTLVFRDCRKRVLSRTDERRRFYKLEAGIPQMSTVPSQATSGYDVR
jgi:hypothetical protein